jgi:glycosyltransferase involved in cell wall biosynthesis
MTFNHFRSIVRNVGRPLLRAGATQAVRLWSPYSRLFLVSDSAPWVISGEMQELAVVAQRLGIRFVDSRWLRYVQHQAVFYGSHFDLLGKKWPTQPHRLGMAYFHGRPGTVGMPEFDTIYQQLCQVHHRIERIQVSHSEMREVVLNSGIAPEKVFLIPIGINLAHFNMQTRQTRQKVRRRYRLPETAVIVGSFQKDGNGWREGLEPKLIKGPDVFLETIEILKSRIPELFVLLSGPARGYVKAGLERLGVPYRHYYLSDYPEIGQLFQTLDVYLVPSRQEGGPKAVLESMASGVPLVTTRVGQATDLVQHGQNGWLVDVEDAEGLAHWTEYAITHQSELNSILRHGRQTAETNSYEAQIPLWRDFMRGFVEGVNGHAS